MAIGETFRLRGDREVVQRLRELLVKAPEVVARGMFQVGEEEMTEAKRLTPVDTGALRASGKTHPPVTQGRQIDVRLTFGGPTTVATRDGSRVVNYAVLVHEDLDAFHDDGQAKYLETPIMQSRPFLLNRIGGKVRLG